MAQLESALLRSNYDEIEKFANKLRKKKELSSCKNKKKRLCNVHIIDFL